MRTLVGFLAASAAFLPSRARAEAPAVEPTAVIAGEVISARAGWSGDRARIFTEVALRDATGRVHHVRQPGGTVDGIGMRVIPAPPVLAVGDQVRVDVARPSRAGGPDSVRAVVGDTARPGALPFVRTTNDTGAELRWASGCVFITYDATGTTHLAADQEHEIIEAVLSHWETSVASCSYMRFQIEPPADVEVGFDRENVIKFRETSWCRPASGDDPEECYDGAAAGLTTLFFVDDDSSPRNGEILDADIELNAVNFSISAAGQTLGRDGCLSDLENTLTHEIGHLLGLDHTCWTGGGSRPTDDDGELVPMCTSNLPPAVTDATMYNFQDCGETKKASLEADDVAAVCAIYPIADDPGVCAPVKETGGCCSAGADPRGAAGAALLAALALLTVARRRAGVPTPSDRAARNS